MDVFLTGATGFLGRFLAEGLLSRGERVVLLVRGEDTGEAKVRARGAIRWVDENAGACFDTNARAVAGSVAAPGLGLSAADRELVLSSCDRYLHCASTVRYDEAPALARAVNVGGTRELLALAGESARRGLLARVDHVSTAYVAGRRTDVVFEHELVGRQGHRNSYESTRFEAEALVREAQAELPVAIFRPSIVVGDSRLGRSPHSQRYCWPVKLYARGWWRSAPAQANASIDLVPVDFVRDAILHIARSPESLGRCFHVAAGVGGAISMGALREILEAFFPDRRHLRLVDPERWAHHVAPVLRHVAFGHLRDVVSALHVYGPYLTANPRFDNRNLIEALAGSSLEVPDVGSYIDRVLREVMASEFDRAAA